MREKRLILKKKPRKRLRRKTEFDRLSESFGKLISYILIIIVAIPILTLKFLFILLNELKNTYNFYVDLLVQPISESISNVFRLLIDGFGIIVFFWIVFQILTDLGNVSTDMLQG